MVLAGQYLERMTVIAAGRPRGSFHLDGLFHRGEREPSVLIAPPHPRAGGSRDTTLVAELAFALTRGGHATLRFDYRGVGASQGERGGHLEDRDDLLSAALHLSETVGPCISLAGVAHGALAALSAATELRSIEGLVLIAPPFEDPGVVDMLEASCERWGYRAPILILAHQRHIDSSVCHSLQIRPKSTVAVEPLPSSDEGTVVDLAAVGKMVSSFIGSLRPGS